MNDENIVEKTISLKGWTDKFYVRFKMESH